MMSKTEKFYSVVLSRTSIVLVGLVGLTTLGCANSSANLATSQNQQPASTSLNTSSQPPSDHQTQLTSTQPQSEKSKQQPDSSPELPFIGTRYFNFLGGSGTGETITIADDGTTIVQRHGTMETSVEYQGPFTNPILLEDGSGLLLKNGKIYSLLANGQIAQGCMGEGQPCESTLQEPSEPPSDDGFAHDDDRFIQQDFSAELFEQVHQINQECGFYDITSSCHVRIYAFRDASLITELNGTESVRFTLTPYQAMSQEQAWGYVQILNNGSDFELIESAERQGNRLVFRGCPYDAGAAEPAALCVAELSLHRDDTVSGITLTHISP